MKLFATYEDKDEAEIALTKISGEKRLASERDSTVVIYNLFGDPSWGNFYKLDMFRLKELQAIVELRRNGAPFDEELHKEIIITLKYVANNYGISIPSHWL